MALMVVLVVSFQPGQPNRLDLNSFFPASKQSRGNARLLARFKVRYTNEIS